VKQKPSISLDDDLAEDDDLGFDPKRPKSGGAKKSLFDDLLTSNVEPKKNIFDEILSGDGGKRPATAKPSMSRQSTDTTTDNSQARPKTSTGRRSSAQSATINADPLGLFGRDTNATVSGMSTPVSRKRGTTADWLGLEQEQEQDQRPMTPKPQSPKKQSSSEGPSKSTAEILRLPDSDENEMEPEPEMTVVPAPSSVTASTQNILMLSNLNLESNQKFNALQQQEAQLVIAAQMKNQERTLLEMQRRQESQDRKFQALIQQQLQRQQQMEDHIKVQQERINMHIQLMMSQPVHVQEVVSAPASLDKPKPEAKEAKKAAGHEQEHLLLLEMDAKRNLLEKQRLDELVANMKVNYEQEIEMIDTSYK